MTVGAMEALLLTFMVGIDPGDEVLITDPSYTNFEGQITLAGGRPVFVQTDPERGYLPHAEDVAAAVTPAHAGHPGQQPVEPDGRRLPARPPARDRRHLRPARPAPRLRRDVRRADVRRHPEREPGVVSRAPRPHGVGALVLEGIRDDGLAHRLPHRPRVDAARDGGRPGADGLVRERGDPACRPRGHPRPPGLRRDDAARLPAAPGPGRRAARPDPRGALPDARRRLLRLPRRPGGDPRHARPGRAAPVRSPGGGLAGRGVRPAVGGIPAALLRLLGRGPGRGSRAARSPALPPPGEADAAGGMPERAAGEGTPYRVEWRDGLALVRLTSGKANALNPRSLAADRARARRGGGRGSARRHPDGLRAVLLGGPRPRDPVRPRAGRHGRVHGVVRCGHAARLRLSPAGGGRHRRPCRGGRRRARAGLRRAGDGRERRTDRAERDPARRTVPGLGARDRPPCRSGDRPSSRSSTRASSSIRARLSSGGSSRRSWTATSSRPPAEPVGRLAAAPASAFETIKAALKGPAVERARATLAPLRRAFVDAWYAPEARHRIGEARVRLGG